VFYTKNDEVLKYAYHGANTAYAEYQKSLTDPNAFNPFKIKEHIETEYNLSVQTAPALGYSGPDLTDENTKNMIAEGKLIPVDLTPYSPTMLELITQSIHPLTAFSATHSYMQYPSPDIMKYAYQKHIMSGLPNTGLNQFGIYDKSKFPIIH
jgi:hypothetical protein